VLEIGERKPVCARFRAVDSAGPRIGALCRRGSSWAAWAGAGWEQYTAGGARVHWKSGGSAGYGSFMAFSADTGRAAVALASCGNCGLKAVDQLTRNLVDEPPQLPSAPLQAQRPGDVTLAPYLGCYELPRLDEKNRQPARNRTQITIVQVKGQQADAVLMLEQGGGQADLQAFNWTRQVEGMAMKVGFTLGGNDTVSLRSKAGPLEQENVRHGQREIYFLPQRGLHYDRHHAGSLAETLVLHVDGWDFFATRVNCSKSW